MTRPAVSQHLRVLTEAGLVTHARQGVRRVYRIDPRGLETMRAYLDRFWDLRWRRSRPPWKEMIVSSVPPVRKELVVAATAEHAFQVFTAGIDRWWPRQHHIGSRP